jgi:hypothetical protein
MTMNLSQVTDTITPSTGGLNVAGLFTSISTIAVSFTVPSGYNAMTVGPITVNSGITITVPSGSRWVVL